MSHSISALILKGSFDSEIAKSYDLFGIGLGFDLTMFPVNHSYTACWAKILNFSGKLPNKTPLRSSLMFPCDLVVAHLMMKITARVDPLFAVIETNYGGGFGWQWAQIYQGTRLADNETCQISPALRFLGVQHQNGMDEFDTVGLRKYRLDPDYLEKYFDMTEELGV